MTENTIAVVGGGFGGVRAALSVSAGLRRHRLEDRYKIVLINRTPFHIYTPLLYKYAVGGDFPRATVAIPLKDILGRNARLITAEVAEADLARGILKLSSGEEIRAGYIVLSPGSETNWFGIQGLKENAVTLKTLEDAEKIRARLHSLPAGSAVVVGGGGPNGVELAAELAHGRRMKVTVVEAMPTLLAGFSAAIQKKAARRLQKLGVEVVLNDPLAHADPESIRTKSGRELKFSALVWTGGMQAPAWLKGLPLKTEARGRLTPDSGMVCIPNSPDLTVSPSVYALGDAVCVSMPDGSPMPAVAHAAILQAEVAAENVLRDILSAEGLAGGKTHKEFRPGRYPYVMPTGGKYAIASIGPLVLGGFLMWVFKEAITIKYFMSILPPGESIRLWSKGL